MVLDSRPLRPWRELADVLQHPGYDHSGRLLKRFISVRGPLREKRISTDHIVDGPDLVVDDMFRIPEGPAAYWAGG